MPLGSRVVQVWRPSLPVTTPLDGVDLDIETYTTNVDVGGEVADALMEAAMEYERDNYYKPEFAMLPWQGYVALSAWASRNLHGAPGEFGAMGFLDSFMGMTLIPMPPAFRIRVTAKASKEWTVASRGHKRKQR